MVHVTAAIFVDAIVPQLKGCSIVIACFVTVLPLLVSSTGVTRQMMMTLASQHVCNVPFMHTTRQLVELQHVRLSAFKTNQSHVYASYFFCFYVAISKLLLCLGTGQSEVPQSGRTLSSIYLLSYICIFSFGMRFPRARHVALTHHVIQWTQRRNEDNRLHSRFIC